MVSFVDNLFFLFVVFLFILEREARGREIIISYPIVAGGRAKQASCKEIRVVFCLFILGGKKGEGIWGCGAMQKTDRYGIRLGYGLVGLGSSDWEGGGRSCMWETRDRKIIRASQLASV